MIDYAKLLRERITALRQSKGISESRMSRELGQSKCYLQEDGCSVEYPTPGSENCYAQVELAYRSRLEKLYRLWVRSLKYAIILRLTPLNFSGTRSSTKYTFMNSSLV